LVKEFHKVMIPEQAITWLTQNGFGPITGSRAAGGGCINAGTVLTTSSGRTFFLKTNRRTPPDMFAREAEGLQALAVEGGPRLPLPYLHGEDFLLLEDLSPAPRRPGYWSEFGRRLAAMHNHGGDGFGFPHDNFIGSTPQPNTSTADGFEFFAEQRLLYMARLARQAGLLSPAQVRQVENLAARLPELVPAQPPALIHGDLWSGNALTGPAGEPALIDPAAHYGWAEAELAMTALFGSFPSDFYRSYEEAARENARPLKPGYRERFPIYNLYHLLNHLVLFGSGYLGDVLRILADFGRER
jgi:protein-ribulosamine 3-kinase